MSFSLTNHFFLSRDQIFLVSDKNTVIKECFITPFWFMFEFSRNQGACANYVDKLGEGM